jgi:hypothetical protein
MYDALVAGMRHQISLIESALKRPLTPDEEIHELREGIFYLNPEDIVEIRGNESKRISYFLLDIELQNDIWLNYAKE